MQAAAIAALERLAHGPVLVAVLVVGHVADYPGLRAHAANTTAGGTDGARGTVQSFRSARLQAAPSPNVPRPFTAKALTPRLSGRG